MAISTVTLFHIFIFNFRHIFLSQTWLDSINSSINCTNTYLYIKKQISAPKEDRTSNDYKDSVFMRSKPLVFPPNLRHIKINLFPDNNLVKNCCQNLLVFGDIRKNSIDELVNASNIKTDDNLVWYQFKDTVQGFKDCFINKTSASELW